MILYGLINSYTKRAFANDGATQKVIERERKTATLFLGQVTCVSRHVNAAADQGISVLETNMGSVKL